MYFARCESKSVNAGHALRGKGPSAAGDTFASFYVRWQHPQRGLVSPATFIPLAEATGLILPLGQWVLQCACERLAKWASDPQLRHLTLAVNVSAHQIHDPGFVEQALAILASTGADPRRLKLG